MLYAKRIVSYSCSFRYLHWIGRVHPTYHQIRRDSPIAICIASESDIFRTYTVQFIQIQLDIFGSTFLIRNTSDIPAMFSANSLQVEEGTNFCCGRQSDMTTQVHIKMLCRKPFSPLHKQSHFIPLYRETRSLQSTGSILNCFTTIADSQRDMEQHRVNIHTFVFTFGSCIGKTGSYDFLTQILYILHHRF